MYPLQDHPPDGGRRQHSMVVMAVQKELVFKGTKPHVHPQTAPDLPLVRRSVVRRAPHTHDLAGWAMTSVQCKHRFCPPPQGSVSGLCTGWSVSYRLVLLQVYGGSALWQTLVRAGAISLRVPERKGLDR